MKKINILCTVILSISFLCLSSCKDRTVEDDTVSFDSSIDGTAALPMPEIDIDTAETIVKTKKPISILEYTTEGASVVSAPAAPLTPVGGADLGGMPLTTGFDPNS